MPKRTYQPKKKIPQFLQPILWSVKVDHLNREDDRIYIINQVLAYGAWKHIKWLFTFYPKSVIRRIFTEQPLKIYTLPAFNFAKEILLNLKNKNLKQYYYDKNLPRHIRP